MSCNQRFSFLGARPGADLLGRSLLRSVILCDISDRPPIVRRPVVLLFVGLVAALGASGCHHKDDTHHPSVAEPPTGWASPSSSATCDTRA